MLHRGLGSGIGSVVPSEGSKECSDNCNQLAAVLNVLGASFEAKECALGVYPMSFLACFLVGKRIGRRTQTFRRIRPLKFREWTS